MFHTFFHHSTYAIMHSAVLFSLFTLALAQTPSISEFTYQGAGCPPGSVTYRLAKANLQDNIFMTFGQFNASSGPSIPLEQGNTTCTLTLLLDHPADVTYAFDSVQIKGQLTLPKAATAILSTTYKHQGETAVGVSNSRLPGPLDGDLATSERLRPVWAPCGHPTPVAVTVQALLPPGVTSNMRIFSYDPLGDGLRYSIVWKKC
jgi:hypothetical protein